jgi:4'-phosphopantetheinyl transferase
VPSFRIAPGQAWAWIASPSSRPWPALALSATERDRMARLYFARDRQAYAAAHALVRHLLSACAPEVAPGAWQFTVSSYGRPELPPPWERLRFNLSHTDGLVACVAGLDVDCGIDVEAVRPRHAGLGTAGQALASYALAPSERQVVSAAPEDLRPWLFCRYWTLKEAYVKARGMGMSLPLEQGPQIGHRHPLAVSHVDPAQQRQVCGHVTLPARLFRSPRIVACIIERIRGPAKRVSRPSSVRIRMLARVPSGCGSNW